MCGMVSSISCSLTWFILNRREEKGKPLWIYSNLVIIILYAGMMQNLFEYHPCQVIRTCLFRVGDIGVNL